MLGYLGAVSRIGRWAIDTLNYQGFNLMVLGGTPALHI